MLKFIALLRLNSNLRILTSIQLICGFGAWFSHVGIFTLLIELNAPVWAVTLCAAMAFIPNIFLAPINGVIVDKFAPKPLLTFMMLIETISVFMLVFIDDLEFLWLLLVLIFVRMGVGTTYYETEMSLLPKVLSKKSLKLANEMFSVIFGVSYTLGMGLAGIFIYYFGVKSAFLFDFALYLVGLAILSRLKINASVKRIQTSILKMMSDGLKYLKSRPLILHFIFLHAFVGVTSYDNLIALLANYEYKELMSASLAIGFMNTSRSVAIIFGPIILSKFLNSRTLFWLLLTQCAGICLWSVLQFNFYLAFAGLLAAGFCISSIWSYTITQIQNTCDNAFYGRVIAYTDMIYFSVAAGISAIIGVLYDLGASLAFITFLLGFAFFVAAFYYKFVQIKYQL